MLTPFDAPVLDRKAAAVDSCITYPDMLFPIIKWLQMYRSTAIFIKILQRRSQFRRVNIFCCYTFINSVGWLNPKYCARKRSVDRVCMGAQSSQTVSTILVFMAIMLTSQWLACFYTCCNTHLLWFWTRMRSNDDSTRKEKKPFNNLNSFVFFAFNVFSHLLFIYVCVYVFVCCVCMDFSVLLFFFSLTPTRLDLVILFQA